MTSITLLPALAVFVALRRPRLDIDGRLAVRVLALIVLGALQYSYLVWRSRQPSTPYLETATLNLHQFWYTVSGAQFRHRLFPFAPTALLRERIPLFLRLLLQEMPAALPFALYGLFARRDRAIRALLLLSLAGPLIFALEYGIPDIEPYFIPVFTLVAILFAIGSDALLHRLAGGRFGHAGALLLLVPALSLAMNAARLDRSGDRAAATKAHDILQAAGSHAAILSPDYFTSELLWYYLIGEGRERDGLYVVHHFGAADVRAYLRGGATLWLPEERKPLPPGLRVFSISGAYAEELRREGLQLTAATPPLTRVE
jgi:hypothetical protein